MFWIVGSVAIIALGLVMYWLFVITEGVYLGRKMVVWLYDITAKKYDGIKQFDADHEQLTIVRPLLNSLAGETSYWVLDVATGTGRVPALLLASPKFTGRIVGLDPAGKMLALASAKLNRLTGGQNQRMALVQQVAGALPFPEDTFNAVTCLEALEFFPSDVNAIREMVRVLKPGGFLMTTRRRGYEARLFIGRHRSFEEFELLLGDLGLIEVNNYHWQVNYDLVTARKSDHLT
jgi:ubiquinone/menaquinone biosynthesis C-methylase UbiE